MLLKIVTAVAVSAALYLPAAAQQRSYYDGRGSFAGSMSTYNNGRNTSFYDSRGRFSGSSIRNSDGTTSLYDRNGHFSGSLTSTSPRR